MDIELWNKQINEIEADVSVGRNFWVELVTIWWESHEQAKPTRTKQLRDSMDVINTKLLNVSPKTFTNTLLVSFSRRRSLHVNLLSMKLTFASDSI